MNKAYRMICWDLLLAGRRICYSHALPLALLHSLELAFTPSKGLFSQPAAPTLFNSCKSWILGVLMCIMAHAVWKARNHLLHLGRKQSPLEVRKGLFGKSFSLASKSVQAFHQSLFREYFHRYKPLPLFLHGIRLESVCSPWSS